MSREWTLLTPENIPVTLELAGLGIRFGALLADLFLMGTGLLALIVVGAAVTVALSTVGASDFASALAILAVFVYFFGYFIFFETLWNGQTPGKRLLGLRVVSDGGFPVTFFSAAVRNLVRVVDFLPGFFGVGAIAAFAHPLHKRLGDVVAGTVVIKERSSLELRRRLDQWVHRVDPLEGAQLRSDVRDPRVVLDPAEQALLARFARRIGEMHPDDAERFAYRLLAPRVERLNLTFTPGAPPRYAAVATLLARRLGR